MNTDLFETEGRPKLLFTEEMRTALNLLLAKVTCNPRGVKRIANVLQIIVSLGRIKPRDKYVSFLPIAQAEEKDWNKFIEKCVHWIFLCENFPFRMSVLAQILLDFEQKSEFNVEKSDAMITYSRSVRGNGNEIPDVDKMSIFEFYMNHVEKYIPVFARTEKFGRNDRDPEEFAYLLKRTAVKRDGQAFITCENVLGPKLRTNERDSMLSLLSYSFNLDPAMRIEVLNINYVCTEFLMKSTCN